MHCHFAIGKKSTQLMRLHSADICSMEIIASELENLINKHYPQLHRLEEEKAVYKPLPNKWSKKELIGHMIDSAQNNIRRFITAQYEDRPKIIYNQDKWVTINNYQDYSVSDL